MNNYIAERAEQIKVIKVSKIKGTKQAIAQNELKLLEGFDRIDYNKRGGNGGKKD
jgi:hypothetical protein